MNPFATWHATVTIAGSPPDVHIDCVRRDDVIDEAMRYVPQDQVADIRGQLAASSVSLFFLPNRTANGVGVTVVVTKA